MRGIHLNCLILVSSLKRELGTACLLSACTLSCTRFHLQQKSCACVARETRLHDITTPFYRVVNDEMGAKLTKATDGEYELAMITP